MSATLSRWLADYGADHRARGNEVCHFLGVPMVAASVLGLLGPWGGAALAAGALAWYARLDRRWTLLFTPAAAALWLSTRLGWAACGVLFVAGWALQFLGHYAFEKRAPAFTRDARFLLIGPLWVFARLLGR
jgi:uncharacterized membrane protein YGL010W